MVYRRRGNVLVYTRLGSQRGVKPENDCGAHALRLCSVTIEKKKKGKTYFNEIKASHYM